MTRRHRLSLLSHHVTSPLLYTPHDSGDRVTAKVTWDEESGTITHAAALPFGCRVAFSYSPSVGFTAEFSPDVPDVRGQRRRRLVAAYRAARDEFVETIAAAIGAPVLTVDVEDGKVTRATEIAPPVRQ
jgi:hypothetical protein